MCGIIYSVFSLTYTTILRIPSYSVRMAEYVQYEETAINPPNKQPNRLQGFVSPTDKMQDAGDTRANVLTTEPNISVDRAGRRSSERTLFIMG